MLDYDMPLYRPPSEGNNLIIQATLGCSFNQCSFCSMYKDKTYQQRPLESVLQISTAPHRDGPALPGSSWRTAMRWRFPAGNCCAYCNTSEMRFRT